MHKNLPTRPNLEHLRGQAKTLLTAFKAGEPQAVQHFTERHKDKITGTIGLADAQFVVARKSGFSSWPKLVHYVEQLRALEGTWLFTSLEVEGSELPASAFRSSRLILNGNRFQMQSREANYEGIFDIDVEADPHTIDIDFVAGPEAGNSSYGIYKCEQNNLKICLGLTGYVRPSAFQTQPGSGHALETLKRNNVDSRAAGEPPVPPIQEEEPASQEGFDVMTPELEQLQGEWIATSLIRDGMVLPPQFYEAGRRVAQGNVTTVTFGNQMWMKACTRLDSTSVPLAIDYLHLEGAATGEIQRGIIALVHDEVQICLAEPGYPRPSDFSSTSVSGLTLSTWRRKS